MADPTTSDGQSNMPPGEDRVKGVQPGYGPHLGYKILKSLALTEVFFCIGMCIGIITPTMLDLSELFKADVEKVSRVLVARSVGMLVGSVILAAMTDKYRRHVDLFLAVETLMMCVTIAAVPWMPNLTAAGVLFSLSGFAWGGISSGGNTIILIMWGEKAAAPLQFVHNGFGVGTLLTPLIAAPFLSTNFSNNGTNQSYDLTYDNENMYVNDIFSMYAPHTNTKIYIPYGIIGGFGVLGAVLMLIYYCRGLPEGFSITSGNTENKTWLQLFDPRSCSGGHLGYGTSMTVGLFFLYVFLVSKDCLGTFVQTYAVGELGFGKHTASILATTYFAGYTLGRYGGMLLSLWLPIQVALFIEAIFQLGVAITLVIFGCENKTAYWVLSVAFGFFAGPMYPAGMSWADRYIEVTALVVSVLDLGIGIGFMLASWLGGYLYTYKEKKYVLYLVAIATGLFMMVLIVIQIVASVHGDRFSKKKEAQTREIEDKADVDERTPLIN